MTKNINGTTPPATLSKAAASLWKNIILTYAIDDTPGRLLVTSALESWDRAAQCQARIKRDGLTVKDRYGAMKPHPLLSVERTARTSMLRALAALRLDIELPPGLPGRPPGL